MEDTGQGNASTDYGRMTNLSIFDEYNRMRNRVGACRNALKTKLDQMESAIIEDTFIYIENRMAELEALMEL